MFKHVPRYPGDPILSLMQTFLADPRPEKTNLSIGLYYDNEGRIPVLNSTQQARERLDPNVPRIYLPMEGDKHYRQSVQQQIFGADHPAALAGRISTIHTLGGSGALKVGADFLKAHFPESQVWISDPTWENHYNILEGAGFVVNTFPYYDPATNGLRFDEMRALFNTLPRHAVVLLQPCCHNPTGIDPNQAQWSQLIDIMMERDVIAFFDMAYQGFGDGLDEDAWVIREMAARGANFLVGNSFSKNMSLYGERVGGLSIVCPDAKQAEQVLGQLQATVRKNYSTPALFGSLLVTEVLSDTSLRNQWHREVTDMRVRIKGMREGLQSRLQALRPDLSLAFLTAQRGMFSYTGLNPEQVVRLREEFGVYVIHTGRMCVAGLSPANLDRVANALAQVM